LEELSKKIKGGKKGRNWDKDKKTKPFKCMTRSRGKAWGKSRGEKSCGKAALTIWAKPYYSVDEGVSD